MLPLGWFSISDLKVPQLTNISGHTFISRLPKKLSLWWCSSLVWLACIRNSIVITVFISLRRASQRHALTDVKLV